MTTGSLPRSLAPLPDESLLGFLLRLSHRLDLPPSRLARLTKLRTRNRTPLVTYQLRIPTTQAAAFAQATRLTLDEVARLGLDSLRDRYPPLELDYPEGSNLVRRSKTLPSGLDWLLTKTSRYCPACLTGNGDVIQSAHGGPWRKQWRLPVVFACPIHRQLLRHHCAACNEPALARGPHNTTLFSGPTLILHPAQCRATPDPAGTTAPSSACGHRLDEHPGSATDPDEDRTRRLLQFQDRLLRQLQLDHDRPVTDPDTGRRYFYDLHLLMRLVRESWPLANRFAPPHVDLGAIDEHIDQLSRTMSTVKANGQRVRNLRLRGGPPEDPHACGNLLMLTEHLRGNTDDGLNTLLSAMPSDPTWARELERFLHHCSPALQAASRPHLEARQPDISASHRRVWAPSRRNIFLTVNRPLTIDHHRISHYLDDQHIHQLRILIPESAISRRELHRFAAVSALRAGRKFSLAAATAELDLPDGWGAGTTTRVHQWLRHNSTAAEFATAMQAVVDSLNDNPPVIDYKHRRKALGNWMIRTEVWEAVIQPLEQADPNSDLCRSTDQATRWRYVTSLMLWASITRGDYRAAPLLRSRRGTFPSFANPYGVLDSSVDFVLGGGAAAPPLTRHIRTLLAAFNSYRTNLENAIDADAASQARPTR